MKTSTKYAAMGIIGGISCLGGSISTYSYISKRDREEYVLKQKMDDAEYRKNNLSLDLEHCLENKQNDCRALFSEYRAVDAKYLALKKESEKSDTPWLPVLVMMGGLAIAYSSLLPYLDAKREERNEKYKEEARKAAAEASKGIK